MRRTSATSRSAPSASISFDERVAPAGALHAVPVERVATLVVDHQEAGQVPGGQGVEEPDGLHALAGSGPGR